MKFDLLSGSYIKYNNNNLYLYFLLLMLTKVQIGIDVGGSCTKIAFRKQQFKQFSHFNIINNQTLYADKSNCAKAFTSAIIETVQQQLTHYQIVLVAISMSGSIDHYRNVVLLSSCLEKQEMTGNAYGQFDLAGQIKAYLSKFTKHEADVVLLHDCVAASVDPLYTEKRVLTLTLGSFPVIGYSDKIAQKQINLYSVLINGWVDEIILSTGNSVENSLNSVMMIKRNPEQNSVLINQAVIKILDKYKEVFDYYPDCMVILGGWASNFQLKKQFSLQMKDIKIVSVVKYEQSVQSQMRGALQYAKKSRKYNFL